MEDKFTATNGATLEAILAGGRQITYSNGLSYPLPAYALEALRQFFRAEEDERLGRWRWPENPDYVIYPTVNDRDLITVLRESAGRIRKVRRYSLELTDDHVEQFGACAEAYFDAHPEPKPWHDAKPGEVWAVRKADADHEVACRAARVNDETIFEPTINLASRFPVKSPKVASARRLWPEDES